MAEAKKNENKPKNNKQPKKVEKKEPKKEVKKEVKPEVKPEVKEEVKKDQIINTEAAKAAAGDAAEKVGEAATQFANKAGEVASKAKDNIGEFAEKVKTDKKTKNTLVGGVICVVAIVVFVLLLSLILPNDTKFVKGYYKAIDKGDLDKISEYYADEYKEYVEDNIPYSLKDKYDDFDEYLEYTFDDYKLIEYEVGDPRKLDKDDLEDLAEDLEDTFDIDEKDVKSATKFKVKVKFKKDGEKDNNKITLYVVKINGHKYIFSGDVFDR